LLAVEMQTLHSIVYSGELETAFTIF